MSKIELGEIRQSQLVTSYGPGAMLDLPDRSVVVMGLERWDFWGRPRLLEEPRLRRHIRERLKVEINAFRVPPAKPDFQRRDAASGVQVRTFPTWFLDKEGVIYVDEAGRRYHARKLTRHHNPSQEDLKRLVPVRFVQSCREGHLSDINWNGFVHRNNSGACRDQLYLDEGPSSSDIFQINVRCACGAVRPLADAVPKNDNGKTRFSELGRCFGQSPWLPRREGGRTCEHPARLLVRAASNSYYPQRMSVISIPATPTDSLPARIQRHLPSLEWMHTIDRLKMVWPEAFAEMVKAPTLSCTVEEAWEIIEACRESAELPAPPPKAEEFATFDECPQEQPGDAPTGDFFARVRGGAVAPGFEETIDKVILVHRLREVVAQVGFTRFEGIVQGIDGELELGVKAAPLSEGVDWLPAVENKGEGIFVSLSYPKVQEWLKRPAVEAREVQLERGYHAYLEEKGDEGRSMPGPAYVMLHTLAHMLMLELSMSCGYGTSALRERVYAGEYGYGFLIMTASSGSGGSLGGLIAEGRRIERHIQRALERASFCSNDPICSGHEPGDRSEARYLHGAACHGCVLVPETSCENMNMFLDRTLVVPTVDVADAAFFELEGLI